jgi:hypothetical protein
MERSAPEKICKPGCKPLRRVILRNPRFSRRFATSRTSVRYTSAGLLNRDPGRDFEGPGWRLHEYVEVAAQLGIVKADTATLVVSRRIFGT